MRSVGKAAAGLLLFLFVGVAASFEVAAAPLASGAGVVSADALNLRAEASLKAPVLSVLRRGDTVVLLGAEEGGWYRVVVGGVVGYVSAEYVSGVEAKKNFSASGSVCGSDVRMRDNPSTSGKVLSVLQAGTQVEIVGINNGWYKARCLGKTGYIRSDLVSIASGGNACSLGQKIADYALKFVGSRYIYGACSPDVGFDCSGLTYYVYKKFGYPISRTASQQYKNNGVRVSREELRPGDLVFFSSNGGRSVTHVGLYIGEGRFVNASTRSTGVILSSINSPYYSRTWYGAKRIVG